MAIQVESNRTQNTNEHCTRARVTDLKKETPTARAEPVTIHLSCTRPCVASTRAD